LNSLKKRLKDIKIKLFIPIKDIKIKPFISLLTFGGSVRTARRYKFEE